jgi:ubiquinone/menaquinone biosynthesis C-methylase UbiE
MSKHDSLLAFRITCLFFVIRDLFRPPARVLDSIPLELGSTVVDYGCGSGGHSIAAARSVGSSGKVHALDMSPYAVARAKSLASRGRLSNLETILTNRETGLPDSSVDVVLLYDTFHDLTDTQGVLKEIHRVLKANGVLSFSDHHMQDSDILQSITGKDLFCLSNKQDNLYTFTKI